MRTLFLNWFHLCFVSEVRKYLDSKGLPFKVLLFLDNAPGYPEPHEFNTEGLNVVYLPPNTNSLIQPLDQGLLEHHKSLEGLHHWRCHHCNRKSCESHQSWNNKFLLEKTVSRCCAWVHRSYGRANQGNHERDGGYGKKRRAVKGFKAWILEKFKN